MSSASEARKELIRKYQETPRPAGVFKVTHKASGRSLVGVSPDTQAKLNRIQAQLQFGSLPIPRLQSDWDADGQDAFEFEVLDLLPPADDPSTDTAAELEVLLELWQDRLSLPEDLRY